MTDWEGGRAGVVLARWEEAGALGTPPGGGPGASGARREPAWAAMASDARGC